MYLIVMIDCYSFFIVKHIYLYVSVMNYDSITSLHLLKQHYSDI